MDFIHKTVAVKMFSLHHLTTSITQFNSNFPAAWCPYKLEPIYFAFFLQNKHIKVHKKADENKIHNNNY